MQIEAYKKPFNESGDVYASKWISYILRQEETGLLCPSTLMTDPRFEQAIADLRAQQIAEFNSTVSPKSLEFWKNRVIPEDDPKMTPKEKKSLARQRMQKARILAQAENVSDIGPKGHVQNLESHVKVHKLVHDLMLTQKYNLTSGVAAGKMFQQQLDKSLLTDPDAEQKIIAAVKAVRDCFPDNMPVVLSVHFDKQGNNPHIHGWVYDRIWDFEKNTWGEVSPLTTTVKGNSDLRKMIDVAILKSTGVLFGNQEKKCDPERPKRTMFTKRQGYWTQQFRGRQDEFLKGDFLKLISNPYEREAMRQLIVQRKYDNAKSQSVFEAKKRKQQYRAELHEHLQEDKIKRMERKARLQDIEEMIGLIDAAENPSPEILKMHNTSAPKPWTHKPAFVPQTGYYKTRQNRGRLAETVTGLYDTYTSEQKLLELQSIRAVIAKIDNELNTNDELSPGKRKNLEFTRDFEIKSLKYLKENLAAPPAEISTSTRKKL